MDAFKYSPGQKVRWINSYGRDNGVRTILDCVMEQRGPCYLITPHDAPWFAVDENELQPFCGGSMKTGLLCTVYKPSNMADCTNGGVSSRYHAVVLVGPDVEGPFEVEGKENVLQLIYREKWGDFIAVPLDYGQGKHYMFGGNFLYTSDARWPVSYPVKIHDRRE